MERFDVGIDTIVSTFFANFIVSQEKQPINNYLLTFILKRIVCATPRTSRISRSLFTTKKLRLIHLVCLFPVFVLLTYTQR